MDIPSEIIRHIFKFLPVSIWRQIDNYEYNCSIPQFVKTYNITMNEASSNICNILICKYIEKNVSGCKDNDIHIGRGADNYEICKYIHTNGGIMKYMKHVHYDNSMQIYKFLHAVSDYYNKYEYLQYIHIAENTNCATDLCNYLFITINQSIYHRVHQLLEGVLSNPVFGLALCKLLYMYDMYISGFELSHAMYNKKQCFEICKYLHYIREVNSNMYKYVSDNDDIIRITKFMYSINLSTYRSDVHAVNEDNIVELYKYLHTKGKIRDYVRTLPRRQYHTNFKSDKLCKFVQSISNNNCVYVYKPSTQIMCCIKQ